MLAQQPRMSRFSLDYGTTAAFPGSPGDGGAGGVGGARSVSQFDLMNNINLPHPYSPPPQGPQGGSGGSDGTHGNRRMPWPNPFPNFEGCLFSVVNSDKWGHGYASTHARNHARTQSRTLLNCVNAFLCQHYLAYFSFIKKCPPPPFYSDALSLSFTHFFLLSPFFWSVAHGLLFMLTLSCLVLSWLGLAWLGLACFGVLVSIFGVSVGI